MMLERQQQLGTAAQFVGSPLPNPLPAVPGEGTRRRASKHLFAIAAGLVLLVPAGVCLAQDAPTLPFLKDGGIGNIAEPQNGTAVLKLLLMLTVLSLAPAILLMMTCFTRIVIVMSLLRQAMGTQQLPPNQILIGLSMFMTFLVMRPTFEAVYTQAYEPYDKGTMGWREALDRAQGPLRTFMIKQIEHWNNTDDVYLFHKFATGKAVDRIDSYSEVSTLTLIPAYVLSELKIAFQMGFTIYLPFLVIDIVISSVLISMGMMMLPPVLISLPFKLLLFVLVDGWGLISGNLMGSFVT